MSFCRQMLKLVLFDYKDVYVTYKLMQNEKEDHPCRTTHNNLEPFSR